MKILFVISSLSHGGAENVMVRLANNWAEIHDVSLITIKDPTHDFFTLNDRVKRYFLGIDRSKWYDFHIYIGLLLKLRRKIKEIDPDYVISFVIKTNIFSLLACPKKIPIIVSEHSVLFMPGMDKKQRYLRKILYPRAHRITVLSDSIKEDFQKVFKTIPIDKVCVIPNPLEISHPEEVKKTNKCTEIIALGRLVPLKGFDKLIRIFYLFQKENPNSKLTIYGEGSYRNTLEALIQNLGLLDKVFLPGTTQNVPVILSQSDINAITSDFEGFSMSIIEAQALGVPCVGFDVPGVRDRIEDGVNGILVQKDDLVGFKDALLKLIEPEIREKIIKNGKNVEEKYSISSINKIWFEECFTDDGSK